MQVDFEANLDDDDEIEIMFPNELGEDEMEEVLWDLFSRYN